MVSETLELVVQTGGGSAAINVLRGVGVAGTQAGINVERMNIFLRETGPIARASGTEATTALQNISRQAEYANLKLGGISSTMRLMRNVLVGLSFFRVFEGLASGVNAMQQSLNLLRTVTPNAQQASAAFDHFYILAQQTRAPMEDIVKLGVQISRTIPDGAEKLGKVDSIVKNIAESFAVAGMNGQQTRNVIRDINEMFAGGTVIMRQFRAILQQDRPLLDSIAQTLVATGPKAKEFNDIMERSRKANALSGGTVTEALHTVPGALLGSDIQRSLEGATKIQKQFGVTTETVGQAITKLSNYWAEFVKHLYDATNGLNFLAGGIEWVGQHIPLILTVGAALASLLVINLVSTEFFRFGSVIKDVFSFVFAPVMALGEMLFNVSVSLVSIALSVVDNFSRITGALADVIAWSTRTAASFMNLGGTIANTFANAINSVTLFLIRTADAAGLAFTTLSGEVIRFSDMVSVAADTSATVIGDAFKDLANVTTNLVQAAGSVGAAFMSLGAQIVSSIAGAAVSALVNMIPLLISIAATALPIAAVGVAIFGLVRPLIQVEEEAKKWAGMAKGSGDIWVDVVTLVISTMMVLVQHFPLFTHAISLLWTDMINSMENDLGGFGNTLDIFNSKITLARNGDLGWSKSTSFQTNRPTGQATGAFDAILKEITKVQPEIQAKVAPFVQQMEKAFSLIGGTGEGPPGPPKPLKGVDAAREALISLIAKYDALAEVQKTVTETQKVFDEAQAKGINVKATLAQYGLKASTLLELEARAAIGLGNADYQAANKITMLNEEQRKYNFTGEDALRVELLKRQAAEAALKTHLDAASGLKLAQDQEKDRMADLAKITADQAKGLLEAADAGDVYKVQLKAISDALGNSADAGLRLLAVQESLAAQKKYLETSGQGFTEAGGMALAMNAANASLANPGKIFETVTADELKKTVLAQNEYSEGLRAVNALEAQHVISAQEAMKATNDLGIAFLKTKQDAVSGFAEGMLEVQNSMNDLAENAAKVWPDLFNGFNKALSDFIDTGSTTNFMKAIHQMTSSVISDLTQMAVKSAIEAPIANALFGGTGAAGGASALGGITGAPASLLGSLTGGLLGGGGAQLGATPAKPLWVSIASSAADVFGGSTATSPGGLLGGGVGGSGVTEAVSGGGFLGAGGSADLGAAMSVAAGAGGGNPMGGYITPGANPMSGAGSILGGGASLAGMFGGNAGLASYFSSTTLPGLPGEMNFATGQMEGGLPSLTMDSPFMQDMSSMGDWMMSMLPGFAGGGEFDVGGLGGTDSQLVAFRATPDETVSIKRPGQQSQEIGGAPQLHMHLHGVSDFDSFKKSKSQLTTSMSQMADRSRARNGSR